MGFELKIDAELGIIYTTAVGYIGIADILTLRQEYSSSPGYRPEFHQLMDLRGGTLTLTGGEAFTLAQLRIKQPLSVKLAIVAGAAATGFARVFQGWTDQDPNTMVFNDIDSAREWLGLPQQDEA